MVTLDPTDFSLGFMVGMSVPIVAALTAVFHDWTKYRDRNRRPSIMEAAGSPGQLERTEQGLAMSDAAQALPGPRPAPPAEQYPWDNDPMYGGKVVVDRMDNVVHYTDFSDPQNPIADEIPAHEWFARWGVPYQPAR